MAEDVPDPDVRLLLANERTLLAWVRTSLTIEAGGVGVLHFGPALELNSLVGLALLLVGALCAATGYRRYVATDRAIRRGRLPSRGLAPQTVTLIVVVLALALFGLSTVQQLTG